MKRDDWMLFALTFLTGFAIGMYVYIAAFRPIYTPEDLSNTEEQAEDWSLVGKERGGDVENGYIHPSFRVLGNGKYSYIPGGEGDDSLEPVVGTLPASLMRELKVDADQLEAYSRPVSDHTCASDTGGFDYEYRIISDGETYTLDTCDTALGDESDLALTLEEVWQTLEGGGSFEGFSGSDPSQWLQDWLRTNIRGE